MRRHLPVKSNAFPDPQRTRLQQPFPNSPVCEHVFIVPSPPGDEGGDGLTLELRASPKSRLLGRSRRFSIKVDFFAYYTVLRKQERFQTGESFSIPAPLFV